MYTTACVKNKCTVRLFLSFFQVKLDDRHAQST